MIDLEGPGAFTLRESWWHGQVQPGKAKLVQQQLFKQNSYLFWLAVPDPEAQVYLDLYDESGQIVETEKITYSEGKYVLSMLVQPQATGFYYIRIGLDKSAKSQQDWALIYAYK